MGCIRILGGRQLHGSLRIQGSKNAALPIIAASVLHKGKTVLHNCPRIADVGNMIHILVELGAEARWEGNSLYLDCTHLAYGEIPRVYADKMRSSIIFMGALLGRLHRAGIPHPGGCVIGPRPIDLHFQVVKTLGGEIQEQEGMIYAFCRELTGGEIIFPKISVGATEQGILAAVLARGVTHLYNCACEPEIQWLAHFLNARGAQIQGAGESKITIYGVERLEDITYRIPPDRIVAGTYLCASAITRSRITLLDAPTEELGAFLEVYRKIGGQYEAISGKLIADGRRVESALPYLRTDVYPGFPTDLQSPLMAVLSTISGISHIQETIFEDRYKAAGDLMKMGAKIRVHKQDAWIEGVSSLRGARLSAPELRGGAALVLAGLAARGETIVDNCEYIERGYEHICEDLVSLGGVISKDTGIDLHEDFKVSQEN